MATLDQVQRLMTALAFFRRSLKCDPPLTENQWELVKLKLDDLISEMEFQLPPFHDPTFISTEPDYPPGPEAA